MLRILPIWNKRQHRLSKLHPSQKKKKIKISSFDSLLATFLDVYVKLKEIIDYEYKLIAHQDHELKIMKKKYELYKQVDIIYEVEFTTLYNALSKTISNSEVLESKDKLLSEIQTRCLQDEHKYREIISQIVDSRPGYKFQSQKYKILEERDYCILCHNLVHESNSLKSDYLEASWQLHESKKIMKELEDRKYTTELETDCLFESINLLQMKKICLEYYLEFLNTMKTVSNRDDFENSTDVHHFEEEMLEKKLLERIDEEKLRKSFQSM